MMHGQTNVKLTNVLFKAALTHIHVTSFIQCVDKVLTVRIKRKLNGKWSYTIKTLEHETASTVFPGP
jgi:hypothetical protein